MVLDSNAIISAFLFGGPPARLLEHVLNGSADCFLSLPILDEVRDVLQRPKFGLSPDQAFALTEALHDLCSLVTPTRKVRAVVNDPDDNIILECAEAADADAIVSGDSHLLALACWKDIRILSPADIVKELEGQPPLSPGSPPRKKGS